MKIFKSMNLVAASLGSTLKKFKQKYSNSITLAVVTINKDIDVVAKMAQKKSQGEAFPGFDSVYLKKGIHHANDGYIYRLK